MPDEAERLRLERDLYRRLLDLGGRDDLAPLVEEALALVVEVTGAQRGYLELHDGARDGAPRVSLARGFRDDEIESIRGELSRGIMAEAIATGRTISTASAVDDPRFREQRSVQAQRIRAVLCAPIGSPAFGVLYLQGRAKPGAFPEDDRAHVETFARHLATLADRLLARTRTTAQDHTRELRAKLSVEHVAGQSRALADVFKQVLVAAPVAVAVLITGETGTGKTAIARAIHDSSPRARGPFVEVNCAAIPETLFESELFGAEKGAHSTATRRLDGKIDAARGGTLFLDEIGELPASVQSKLLMFLQSRRYYRLGSTAPIEADVRVVAATNADLAARVQDKSFREDLYYRLNVLPVHVPPLRARADDVPAIADAVLEAIARSHGERTPIGLSRAARLALLEAEWPGNVRQLENVLQRGWAVARSESSATIEPSHLFPTAVRAEGDAKPVAYQDAMRAFQARFLREALDACGWNVAETARRSGLARSHLNDLIRAHGLVRPTK